MNPRTLPASRRPPDARPDRSPWLYPGLTALAAVAGGLASGDAPSFYAQLVKPDAAPPAAVFGPVWGVLYVMMAVAAYLVARTRHAWREAALAAFVAQLVANAAWSWLFFRLHDGALALAELSVLWLLVAATLGLFMRIRRAAGWLMAPVLAWVSFAGWLNFVVWRSNPGLL